MKEICGKRCKSCVHHTYMPNPPYNVGCVYLTDTGHCRPCLAGDECTVYEKGNALERKQVSFCNPNKIMVKKCRRCGKEFEGSYKKRFCDGCTKTKNSALTKAVNERIRAKKKEEELAKDKICLMCGAIYHKAINKGCFCDECMKLPKWRRTKARKDQANEQREC